MTPTAIVMASVMMNTNATVERADTPLHATPLNDVCRTNGQYASAATHAHDTSR
jgi:hypothetical protein